MHLYFFFLKISGFSTKQSEIEEQSDDLVREKDEVLAQKFKLQCREKELQSNLSRVSSRSVILCFSNAGMSN